MDLRRDANVGMDADKAGARCVAQAVGCSGAVGGSAGATGGGAGADCCGIDGKAGQRQRAAEWVAAACSLADAVTRRGEREGLAEDEVVALMRLEKVMRQVRTCA